MHRQYLEHVKTLAPEHVGVTTHSLYKYDAGLGLGFLVQQVDASFESALNIPSRNAHQDNHLLT